ncbi:MAG TPA: hypothetical protein VG244_02555 [Acidimicrobiales bacterium]|jgi:hypothetical protein|nr:hypothetical protein [Acidimicrobiales bacterium]
MGKAARKRHREEKRVHALLDEGDLEGLADLLNDYAGAQVAEVDHEGLGLIPGTVASDLDEFRQRVREDPGGALDLVRGPPLGGVDWPWAVPLRAEIQSEIAAAAHAACRLDPTNAADYLRKGLTGAPHDVSLWIALLGLAGRGRSIRAVEMAYGWARDTFATGVPDTVPTDITREYERWQRKLRSS